MAGPARAGLPQAIRDQMTQTAGSSVLGAALLLFFGFYYGLEGISASGIYNASVALFTWTLRIGGFALLGAALLCYAGIRPALAIDALIAGLIGLALVATGAVWLIFSDFMGILNLIFGVMFISSARQSWQGHLSLAATGAPGVMPETQPLRDVPAAASPAGASARDAARERLLRTKQNLRGADPEPGAGAGAGDRPAQPTVQHAASQEAAMPTPLSEPASTPGDPGVAAVPRVDEEVEGGFLAELGRSDENERT